ncbi:MAG: PEGA domain-containing protein, partial [Calditrichia bacterium]
IEISHNTGSIITLMKKKFPLSYQSIQRIKAEEYERFFSDMPDYYLYVNHLGEVHWMSEEQADKQHEFFLYSEPALRKWWRRLHLKRAASLRRGSTAERETRLRIRCFLEKRYLGAVTPETRRQMPETWHYDIQEDEIEQIPIIIDAREISTGKKLLIIFISLLAVALAVFFFYPRLEKAPAGKIFVQTNLEGARIYLDGQDFLGYSNSMISDIEPGIYQITARKEGYTVQPLSQQVQVISDSLVKVSFNFERISSLTRGYLKVIADEPASGLFLDDAYMGKLPPGGVLPLNEGQHRVRVYHEGFISAPAEKLVTIFRSDTTILRVDQVPAGRSGSSVLTPDLNRIGSIAVNANVRGARIFLNGQDSGAETDYIFTRLKPGDYTVRVEKKGYFVEPSEVNVKINSTNSSRNAAFHLTKEFEQVSISLSPAGGEIFVDNELKGEDHFSGALKAGIHKVHFGPLEGYKTPPPREIEVIPGRPLDLKVTYFPVIRISAGINSTGSPFEQNCEIVSGYTLPRRSFMTSSEAGPDIVFNDALGEYLWKLGYAFPYRNPTGSDALRIIFNLPRDMQPVRNLNVRMLAASSRDKYPFSLSASVDVEIKVNNSILSYNFTPQILEKIGGLKSEEWEIGQYVRPGENYFEVTTTERNNQYFLIKRIEIYN